MAIKIGACGSIDSILSAQRAGYAYLETAFQNIAKMSDEEFETAKSIVDSADIKVEACNGYFSPDITLIGDDIDFDFIEKYSRKGFERTKKLGCQVVVIGSGKARNIPENVPFEKGFKQFAKVVVFCADIAKDYGISVVVEPLNRKETNLINTVFDGLELCKKANNDNVKALADFYHVFMNDEGLDGILAAKGMLVHTHLARPNEDRRTPKAEDEQTLRLWANALKEIGYNGRISLECVFESDYEADLKTVRKIMTVFED